MNHVLKIENLHVSVAGKPILRGVNLEMQHGTTHGRSWGPTDRVRAHLVS